MQITITTTSTDVLSLLDFKKWIRTAIIIYAPVLLITLNQLQEWKFDINILYWATISITIDLIRRYLTNYSK